MARLQLNKSSLARETAKLAAYQRYLPSLDLKRRQLIAERVKATRALARTDAAIATLVQDIGARVPMLANEDAQLHDLVVAEHATHGEENVVGVRLPTLESTVVTIRPYSFLARPHWVDFVAAKLRTALELHLQRAVQARRVEILEEAVNKVAQRVNLFEKVLIPHTQHNIKRIRIRLSDEQVSAVVRSKLAKRKHAS